MQHPVPIPGFLDGDNFKFLGMTLSKKKIVCFNHCIDYVKKNRRQQTFEALYLEDIASAIKSIPNVVRFAGAGPFCQLGVITDGKFTAASIILVRANFKIYNSFISRCLKQFQFTTFLTPSPPLYNLEGFNHKIFLKPRLGGTSDSIFFFFSKH